MLHHEHYTQVETACGNTAYLSLEYVDLPVLDVDLIPQLGELVGQAVLVLGRAQRGLGLLLDHLVLLL